VPDSVVKKGEKGFKRLVQAGFRLAFSKGDPSRYPVDPESVKSILVLRPDKLGDMIATIPAMHALKERLPHARVEVIASPRNKMLVQDDPVLDAVHIYTKNIFRDLPMINRLKRQRFDIVYDPICHDSVTGLILTEMIAGKGVRAASRKLELHRYYDYCVNYEPEGHDHSFENAMLVFNVLGIDPSTIDPFKPPHIPPQSREKAESFLKTLPETFKVGVNISAGSASRTLSAEKYRAVLDTACSEYPTAYFVISCTPDEREKAERIRAAQPDRCCLVPAGLSFHDVCAILGGLDLLISPDTSLVHVARLFQVPVLGLFSGHKRNFYFWRPFRQDCGWVVSDDFDHLLNIEPAQITDELRRLVNSNDVSRKVGS